LLILLFFTFFNFQGIIKTASAAFLIENNKKASKLPLLTQIATTHAKSGNDVFNYRH
jgi:hypothetical protein